MKYPKLLIKFFLLMALLITGGCGGAGDLSGTLTLAVTPAADSTQPGTATATYRSASGQNPIGVEINFSTDRPDLVALSASTVRIASDGTATITFQTVAVPTSTTVRINATTGGISAFKTFVIAGTAGAPPVTPPQAGTTVPNALSFIAAVPSNISLRGTGGIGRSETSIVTFEVRDNVGNVMAGQTVDFTLDNNLGGISIAPASAVSDSAGRVQAIINAGNQLTSVRVTATVRNTAISAGSTVLTITSGLPDQDSFSLAAATLNPEAGNHNGVVVAISTRMADHFNNPPPDGTAVTFTTSGGKIIGSATTVNGVATVNWESSDPRPANGRVDILAYAVGEESFTDLNGNGLADPGEFTDTGLAFRDDNFNGVRDANEPYIPFNQGDVYSTGDGQYNGAYQGAAFVGATKSKHIFQNIELVMSTDAAIIRTDLAGTISGPTTFNVLVTDLNENTMANGTTISVTTDNGKLSGGVSFTVPNNTGHGFVFPVILGSDGTVSAGGAITITVKSPGGLQTVLSIPVDGV